MDAEVDFLKGFPIMDDLARNKAKKARDKRQKDLRAEIRAYKGPMLFSDEDREAEQKRKDNLRIQFNRASARRSKIRREAEQLYQAWAHPILVNKAKDAEILALKARLAKYESLDTNNNTESRS